MSTVLVDTCILVRIVELFCMYYTRTPYNVLVRSTKHPHQRIRCGPRMITLYDYAVYNCISVLCLYNYDDS